ncbi:MAG: VOC family protein [Daejeonella sp.]
MGIKINILSLAVSDFKRSLNFYREGLGLGSLGLLPGSDHVSFDLQDGLSLVLYQRSEIAKLTLDPNLNPSPNELILSYAAADKNEIDSILAKVENFGGQLLQDKPNEEDWGYSGYFKDPDGHVWEIMWIKKQDS